MINEPPETDSSWDSADATGWIKPIKGRRTFEEIIDQLEAALLSGRLLPGGRLPPEREFAAALGVSRASLREALRVLEALDLVDIQRGPFGAVLKSEPGDAFADILRLHLALGHYPRHSIVELRCILESWAFGQTADSADDGLLARLSALLTKMADPSLDPRSFNALDVAFHAAVIDGSGNELAAVVLRGCRTVNREEMLEGISRGTWSETAKSLTREHQRLFELIKKGDADGASRLVGQHIRKWAARSPELVGSPGSGRARRGPKPRGANPI